MFADDNVICSESRKQVEENPERWRNALEMKGIRISQSKTEYVCLNERNPRVMVMIQRVEIKKV